MTSFADMLVELAKPPPQPADAGRGYVTWGTVAAVSPHLTVYHLGAGDAVPVNWLASETGYAPAVGDPVLLAVIDTRIAVVAHLRNAP